MGKLAEQRRREKEETRTAKQRVLEQIAADKAARQAEKEGRKAEEAKPVATPAAAAAPAPKKDYNECRIQIRQVSGQPIVHTFGVKEQLAAVRLYVQMNRTDGETGPVKLMTSFPRKVFSDEDYENTLENLGLVPSAVIMVTK